MTRFFGRTPASAPEAGRRPDGGRKSIEIETQDEPTFMPDPASDPMEDAFGATRALGGAEGKRLT